ncbi:MAG: IS200/IS605 family transposase [Bacteroidota bacterium]
MVNTYSQIYIQIVFTVKNSTVLIRKEKREELYKYITGIVRKRNQKLLAINVMPDHIHVFVGMNPDVAISDLVRDIKAGSSGFINEKKWFKGKFSWQEGFWAFSYSQLNMMIGICSNG